MLFNRNATGVRVGAAVPRARHCRTTRSPLGLRLNEVSHLRCPIKQKDAKVAKEKTALTTVSVCCPSLRGLCDLLSMFLECRFQSMKMNSLLLSMPRKRDPQMRLSVFALERSVTCSRSSSRNASVCVVSSAVGLRPKIVL